MPELITGMNINLVGEASVLTVAHIERVEKRIDTKITLVVLSEIGLDTVQHVIAHGIPKHAFCPTSFLLYRIGSFFFFVLFMLQSDELSKQLFFLLIERIRTDLCHEQRVVELIGYLTVERITQAEL